MEDQLKKENNESLNKIKELENKLILKNNELNDLKNRLQNNNNVNNINNINNINFNRIENNFKNIDKCVTFVSSDMKIVFGIPCSGNSTFAEVEELLYREYPEYRETNNTFLVNGKQVLRFKTINENNAGTGRPVMLIKPE